MLFIQAELDRDFSSLIKIGSRRKELLVWAFKILDIFDIYSKNEMEVKE